jgi:hypothetical protein
VLGANSSVERAEQTADLLAKGFAEQSDGKPVLADMKPFGDLETVTNLRPVICAKKRAGRRTKRDKNGHIIFNTGNLHPFNRAPVAVSVGLGGAKGISGSFIEYYGMPVPTPRPTDEAILEASEGVLEDASDSGDIDGVDDSGDASAEIVLPAPAMTLSPFQTPPPK